LDKRFLYIFPKKFVKNQRNFKKGIDNPKEIGYTKVDKDTVQGRGRAFLFLTMKLKWHSSTCSFLLKIKLILFAGRA